jgi:glycosyltransferase involved in cell wall biosynthesis
MVDNPTKPRQQLIAAIVPTYNEALNVSGVLDVLKRAPVLDEIILVDDGSTDKTIEILRHAALTDSRIRVIQHEKNKGKGQAIFTGWAATCAQILLLLDADLKALTPDHIQALATDLSHWFTPFLTGQRALRADLLKHLSHDAAAGYGFEVALTVAASKQNYRKRIVFLKGVWHPSSEFRTERGGYWNGKLWKFRMYGQIIRAWLIATGERYPKAREFFSDINKT